jgi:hypothetical protein
VREIAECFPRRSTAHRGWPNSRPAAIHTQGDTSLSLPPRLTGSHLLNCYHKRKLTTSITSRSSVLSLGILSCINQSSCAEPRRHNQPAGLPVVHARRSPMRPRPSPAPSARPWHPSLPQRSYHLSKYLSRVPFRSHNHQAPLSQPPSLLPHHYRHPHPLRPPLHQPRAPLAVVRPAGLRRRRSLRSRMWHMPTMMRRRFLLGHAST